MNKKIKNFFAHLLVRALLTFTSWVGLFVLGVYLAFTNPLVVNAIGLGIVIVSTILFIRMVTYISKEIEEKYF